MKSFFSGAAIVLFSALLAACGGGGSSFSPPEAVSPPETVRPSVRATEFTATPINGGGVALSWNAVSGADGYRVYRDGVLLATIDGDAPTAFVDENSGEGDSASYAIEAFSRVPFTVVNEPPEAPEPPENAPDKPSGARVVLKWDVPSYPEEWEIEGYKIFRNNEEVAEVKNGETTWIDENPGDVGSYYYNIFAIGGWQDRETTTSLLSSSYRVTITSDTSEIVAPLVDCEGGVISSCFKKTMSHPIAHSGDAVGLYDGERDGDVFAEGEYEYNGKTYSAEVFTNACLPDGKCRSIPSPLFGNLFGRAVFLISTELITARKKASRDPQEHDGESFLVEGNLRYSNLNKPEYASLGRWIFETIDKEKENNRYRSFGYSIFADNTVAPPSSGTARYDVRADVQYNAPHGDYPHYGKSRVDFNGMMNADFAQGVIDGRLTGKLNSDDPDYHLDFSGRIADDCNANAACFSGKVTADDQFRDGLAGKTGDFQGAFYDDPDSYDGISAPREIGGVFGGLFNEDGGELVGGFLGGVTAE